jgi:hypothetical protein
MNPAALKALQDETSFLSGVESNLDAARGKLLRGTEWRFARHDDQDRLKGMMATHRNYDRELLKSLPANRRISLHGFERRLWFWRRKTGVAVASVLTPLSHFAAGASGPPPPVGLGDLLEHVRQFTVEAGVPHVIGVCSPTGFTPEARTARFELPNVSVVLIEPDANGGWKTEATSESVDPRVLRLFDPESSTQKLERVRRALEEYSADLLTGGLAVDTLAARMQLPVNVVKQAVEEAARQDPELRLAARDGELLLYRGAPVTRQEKTSMNVVDRIRQLFSRSGDESAKINLLSERRAALSRRRERIYEDIIKLEQKESELLAQGKAATSDVTRRRLAAQLAQMRKDISRQNTAAAVLNQQINIISTDIHNLTLILQGQAAQLPDTEELTENAVHAEELLESLKADSELVQSLAAGMETVATSEEELAILKEFESAETPPAAMASVPRTAVPPVKTPASPVAQRPAVEPAPTPEPDRPSGGRRADAEAG